MNNAIYRSGHLHNAISIDPFSLSRAEVVYGPSSVGYGSDALGGVVHYFTKEPRVGDAQPWRFFIANSYDTRHEHSINHVDITHSNDKWASLTSASYSILGISTWAVNAIMGMRTGGWCQKFLKIIATFSKTNHNQIPTPIANTIRNMTKSI